MLRQKSLFRQVVSRFATFATRCRSKFPQLRRLHSGAPPLGGPRCSKAPGSCRSKSTTPFSFGQNFQKPFRDPERWARTETPRTSLRGRARGRPGAGAAGAAGGRPGPGAHGPVARAPGPRYGSGSAQRCEIRGRQAARADFGYRRRSRPPFRPLAARFWRFRSDAPCDGSDNAKRAPVEGRPFRPCRDARCVRGRKGCSGCTPTP